MASAIVVNKYHNIPYDVWIGRPSKWGNPYSHMEGTLAKFKVETREEAVEKHMEYLLNSEELLNDIHELYGKIMGCVCKPKQCHGDNYVRVLDFLISKLGKEYFDARLHS